MKAKEEFYKILDAIDGQPFEEYRQILGDFDFTRYVVKIVSLPPRPGEGYSSMFLRVPQTIADIPPSMFEAPVRRTGLEDYLTRRLSAAIARFCPLVHGRETSGRVFVDQPQSAVLPRTSMVVTDEYVECRVSIDLPSRDGKILASVAREVFFEELPRVVNDALVYANLDHRDADRFVRSIEQADQIRQALAPKGLVAFVADGSILPAPPKQAYGSPPVPFESPASLRVALELPDGTSVTGMGIPEGITVITGPAYSGKSTLVDALKEGVYYHAPVGRPWQVVTQFDCIKVCSEPGRAVQGVNLAGFFRSLPGEADPAEFSTLSADALTSQAAALVEAIEIGTHCILIDEDESAPTFLSGDAAAAALFGQERRGSHTPLAHRMAQLKSEFGVSFILAAENPGELLAVADRVLVMDGFRPNDVSRESGEPAKALPVPATPFPKAAPRRILGSSLDASSGLRDPSIDVDGVSSLRFGRDEVDLSRVEQIADEAQARTIALIIHYAKLRYMDEDRPVSEVLDRVERDLTSEGIDALSRDLRGDLARPRRFEVAAVMNRLPSMRVRRLGAE